MKFKGVFAVIKDLLFDCNIYFDESGMKICNLDNSKVALVHFKAPANNFAYYYCERPQVLGVSILALYKYLGHISQNNHYTLKLMVERGKPHEMILEIASDDDTDTQRFYMKLLDLELDEGGLDGEVFNCIINIPSDKFQRYCRSHALVGDVMDIITVGDQVELCTEDTDGGDRTKSIIRTMDEDEERNNNSDDDPATPVVVPKKRNRAAAAAAAEEEGSKIRTAIYLKDKEDPISGRFALKFLQMFAKAQSLSPNVVIYFKKDYPLVLLYKMSELGELKFALAPRLAPTTL
jgi:proliferating cell nuclear antigen